MGKFDLIVAILFLDFKKCYGDWRSAGSAVLLLIMVSGSTGIKLCKKGENCAFFHPDICKVMLESGSCSKKDYKCGTVASKHSLNQLHT